MQNDFMRTLPVACALGLAVAAIDASAGFVGTPSRFTTLSFTLSGVAGVLVLTALLYVLARWLAAPRLSRPDRGDRGAVSIAIAMGIGATLVAYQVDGFDDAVESLFDLSIALLLGAIVATGSYALARVTTGRDDLQGRANLVALAARTLPLLLLVAVCAAWVAFVVIDDVTSVRFALLLVALLIVEVMVALVVAAMTARVWRRVILSASALVIALGALGVQALHTDRPRLLPTSGKVAGENVKHVILISVDTLRRDALSCYGSTTVATPNIDRIANDGCRFEHVISSSSWTLPAFASMMTGLTTGAHGVTRSTAALPDTVETLAERLRSAGYRTHALVPNLMIAPDRGFGQGFARFYRPGGTYRPNSLCEAVAARFLLQPLSVATSTRDVTDAAITFAQSRRDKAFFLWAHYLDPHLPYTPPIEFVERMNVDDELGFELDMESATRPSMDVFGDPSHRAWARSLYDGEVRYVDSEIGRLLDALQASGIYDDALVVFASDHGEEFWDHDGFEHGHTLFNELIDVPLIIKLPRSHERREVSDMVSICDITPTILDVCKLPPVDAPDAVSLTGYLTGTSRPSPAARVLHSRGTLFRSNFEAVVWNGWKYIHSATSGHEQLYNLGTDPGEHATLIGDDPAAARRGAQLLNQQTQAVERFRQARGIANPEIKLDADEIDRLRSLGYL